MGTNLGGGYSVNNSNTGGYSGGFGPGFGGSNSAGISSSNYSQYQGPFAVNNRPGGGQYHGFGPNFADIGDPKHFYVPPTPVFKPKPPKPKQPAHPSSMNLPAGYRTVTSYSYVGGRRVPYTHLAPLPQYQSGPGRRPTGPHLSGPLPHPGQTYQATLQAQRAQQAAASLAARNRAGYFNTVGPWFQRPPLAYFGPASRAVVRAGYTIGRGLAAGAATTLRGYVPYGGRTRF